MKNIIQKNAEDTNFYQIINSGEEETLENSLIIELKTDEDYEVGYDYYLSYSQDGVSGEIIEKYNDEAIEFVEFEIPSSFIQNAHTGDITISIKYKEHSASTYTNLLSFVVKQPNRIYSTQDWLVSEDDETSEIFINGTSQDPNAPCIKTMVLSENYNCSTSSNYANIPLSNYTVVGTDLSAGLNSTYNVYGVRIGANISQVLISGQATVINNNNSSSMSVNIYAIIGRGSTNIVATVGRIASLGPNGIASSVSFPNLLINVQEGDVITLRLYKTLSNGVLEVSSDNNRTFLTVQKVA